MTEFTNPDPERLAKRAVWDYLSVGPEVGFGELETEAIDDWLADCEGLWLPPMYRTNMAWMYVERAWGRAAENGVLAGHRPPKEIAQLTRGDLVKAGVLFQGVLDDGDSLLRTHAGVSRLSLSLFEMALVGRRGDVPYADMQNRNKIAQFEAIKERLAYFKSHGRVQDIPPLNTSLGMAIFTLAFLDTDYVPLPSAYRHFAGRGSHYNRWHAALHNRDNGHTYKMRVAPNGPPDYIVIPPDLFGHDRFPSKQGMGTFEALVRANDWHRTRAEKPPEGLTAQAITHIDSIDIELGNCIDSQVSVLAGLAETPSRIVTGEYPQWYAGLSPFEDPCHASWDGALELAISDLEVHYAEGTLRAEDQHTMAWMYMESALSFEAQQSGRPDMMNLSFNRAEDILRQLLSDVPRGSSQYYETAFSLAAAPVYNALVTHEETEVVVEAYTARLAEVAHEMLEYYGTMSDAQSPEAMRFENLLHRITACLTITATDTMSDVALPAAPRQRGGGERPRGWDVAVWTQESNEFEPGMFTCRIEDTDDPHSVHNGVITVTKKALGHGSRAYNFRTLRTLLDQLQPGSQPRTYIHHRSLAQARRTLAHITNANE